MRAVISTDDCHMAQYALYIRRSEQAMRLVEKSTRKPVQIEAYFPASKSDGVFVRPRDGTGIYLMSDEIIHVSEFPEVK